MHLLEFLYYVKTLKIDKQQSMENLSVQKYGDGSSKKRTLALLMNIKEIFSNRMEGIAKGKVKNPTCIHPYKLKILNLHFLVINHIYRFWDNFFGC